MDKSNFDYMDYADFVGAHGGRRTAALAGRFRKRKGLEVNDSMQQAMQAEAQKRMLAQATNEMSKIAPDAPSKPLPELAAKGEAIPAPRLGGRTTPGTTPRKVKFGPPDASDARLVRHPWPGTGTQIEHPWTPRPAVAGRMPNDSMGPPGRPPRTVGLPDRLTSDASWIKGWTGGPYMPKTNRKR